MALKDFLFDIINRNMHGEHVCPECGHEMEFVEDEDIWECPNCYRGITNEAFKSGFFLNDDEEAEVYGYDDVYDDK